MLKFSLVISLVCNYGHKGACFRFSQLSCPVLSCYWTRWKISTSCNQPSKLSWNNFSGWNNYEIVSDVAMRTLLALMALFTFCVMRRDSAKRHILGVAHPGGGLLPQIRTRFRFLYDASTPSFIMLCLLVRKLSCWHTNKPTNPQTYRFRRKHPIFFATLRRWVINEIR